MPVLDDNDIQEIRNARAEVRADNIQSIVLRRGRTTLAPQDFRVELSGNEPDRLMSDGTQEQRSKALLDGEIDADVQPEDRFTLNGYVYQVIFVSPRRETGTLAKATIAQ